MKRVDAHKYGWVLWIVSFASASLVLTQPSYAQSARFTVIDARNGLTPEVQAAYAEAMGAMAETPHIKSRIKILANPRHGADFEAVDVPDHVRHVDLDVDLILQGGHPVIKPIDLNHLRLARRSPQRISQKTTIRGH